MCPLINQRSPASDLSLGFLFGEKTVSAPAARTIGEPAGRHLAVMAARP
jgi:hypothetical protein